MTNEIRANLLGCELNCVRCGRTMIPGEVFANGYADGPSVCHACKKDRNARLDAELAEMNVVETLEHSDTGSGR